MKYVMEEISNVHISVNNCKENNYLSDSGGKMIY